MLGAGNEMQTAEFCQLSGDRFCGNIHECVGMFFHSPDEDDVEIIFVAFRSLSYFTFDRGA